MGRSFLEGRSYVRGRVPNLNRLSSVRGKYNILSLIQFSVRAILGCMYVQLDARLIKKGCGKIVCSWKSFELESAEPCEERKISPSA